MKIATSASYLRSVKPLAAAPLPPSAPKRPATKAKLALPPPAHPARHRRAPSSLPPPRPPALKKTPFPLLQKKTKTKGKIQTAATIA
jgi:hypothetical protein